MKEVKITIDGKEYAKTEPMIKDWKNLIACQIKNKEKNVILDFEPMDEMVKVVADFVSAPAKKILAECPVSMITEAYRAIDANVAEAFTGTRDEKNAEGRQRPKKQ